MLKEVHFHQLCQVTLQKCPNFFKVQRWLEYCSRVWEDTLLDTDQKRAIR